MRKFFSILIAFVLIFGWSITSYALTSSVELGNAEGLVFNPTNKDLFADFKNIMPGDTKKQLIALKNTKDDVTATVYMKAQVEEEDKDFLQWMTLNIYYSDTIDGPKILLSKNKASEEGNLIDFISLGTLNPSETRYITVELYCDHAMNNTQALKKGIIHWIFAWDEEEMRSNVSAPNNKPTVTRQPTTKAPKTSDNNTLPFTGSNDVTQKMLICIILMMTTLISAILIIDNRNRRCLNETQ